MKITIEATQEEVKELLQAIGSSKEQLNFKENNTNFYDQYLGYRHRNRKSEIKSSEVCREPY